MALIPFDEFYAVYCCSHCQDVYSCVVLAYSKPTQYIKNFKCLKCNKAERYENLPIQFISTDREDCVNFISYLKRKQHEDN